MEAVPICMPRLPLAPISQRAYIPRTQLPTCTKSDHFLCWRYLQKHMLSHLKLQRSSIRICPTLLSVLCCTKVLLDGSDLVHCLYYHIRSQISSLTNSSQHNVDLHLLPYRASNGAILMLANSAKCRWSSHDLSLIHI